MNRILYILLFCISYSYVYGSYSMYTSISSVNSIEQPAQRIGYTTNYSNGQYNSSVYSSGLSRTSYTNYSASCFNHSSVSGPHRSAQRPYSGGAIEDFLDWLRINTDSDWPSYVDDDYWEQFFYEHPEYKDAAANYFASRGLRPPWDPYPTPIKDDIFLIIPAILYIIYKRRFTGIFYAII